MFFKVATIHPDITYFFSKLKDSDPDPDYSYFSCLKSEEEALNKKNTTKDIKLL